MLEKQKEREKPNIRNNSVTKNQTDQIVLKSCFDKEHGFSIRYANISIQGGIPYFNYINPQLNNKLTIIPLNQLTSCKFLGKGKFIVGDNNTKMYIFQEREYDVIAQQWINTMNKYINLNNF